MVTWLKWSTSRRAAVMLAPLSARGHRLVHQLLTRRSFPSHVFLANGAERAYTRRQFLRGLPNGGGVRFERAARGAILVLEHDKTSVARRGWLAKKPTPVGCRLVVEKAQIFHSVTRAESSKDAPFPWGISHEPTLGTALCLLPWQRGIFDGSWTCC